MHPADAESEIRSLVARFANAFDLKDWDALEPCLAESVYRVLDTHCLYLLELSKSAVGWRISSITQNVLWSDGDPAIHSGIVTR